jgi:hypothetical protein
MIGSYNGLFYETNAVSHHSSGAINFTISTRRTFSGKVLIDGGSYLFTGQFDTNGAAAFEIPRTGKTTLSAMLQIDLANELGQVNGTITDGSWLASMQGVRAADLPALAPGKYTMAFAGHGDGSSSPGGDGIGQVTLATNGTLTLSGTLSDNTAVAQSIKIGRNGQWPLYLPLYGGRGSMLGWINFTNEPASQFSGAISWIKTNAYGGYCTNGFTNEVSAIGSALSLAASPLLNLTNGIVILDGANLTNSFTNTFTLSSNGLISITTTNNHLTLTLNKTNGNLSGSFINPVTRLASPVRGVLLQSENTAHGYFYTPNKTGSFWLGAE